MVDAAGGLPARAALSVAELVREVGEILAGRWSVCTVRGEISGFSRAASGHFYFNLRDGDGKEAMLRCAMFRRATNLLTFVPADGQTVEVRARLGVYEPRGELQLVVEAMQRGGVGALYEQLLRLRVRLESQGLFDAARKRGLPPHPRRVGVVTSLGAAALRDVLTALARRSPHVHVVVYPSLVQGLGAPAALSEAINLASARGEVDVLIVCRGGGSLEDLWSFNDEQVVRALAATSMPVVTGVGHETDVTLADLAADLRAPTPTAAAELAAPRQDGCLSRLDSVAATLQRRVRETVDVQAQRLDRNALRLVRPSTALRLQGQIFGLLAQRFFSHLPRAAQVHVGRIDQLERGLRRAVIGSVSKDAQKLEALAARLRALDPKRVLSRGYAWLIDDDGGRPITSVRQIKEGTALLAVLQDGTADLRVTRVRHQGSD